MERYLSPLRALADWWPAKAVVAMIGILFRIETEMIAALVVLFTLDFITGIRAARKRGERITSARMRGTISKGIDYAIWVIIWTVAGNIFPLLAWTPRWACMFVALTEIKSIVENTFGKRAEEMWRMFQEARGKRGEEEKKEAVE